MYFVILGCSNPNVKNININCISIHSDSSYTKGRNFLKIRVKSNIDLKNLLNTSEFQSIMMYAPIIKNDSFYSLRKFGGLDKMKNQKYLEFNLSNNNILESIIDSNLYIYETNLELINSYQNLPFDSAIIELEHYFENNDSLRFQGYWTPYFLKGHYKATDIKEFFVNKEMIQIKHK